MVNPTDPPAVDLAAELPPLLPALYGTALRFCRNGPDAEDLVQEACVKAVEHIDQFQPGTNFKAWLFTILANTFYSRYRRAKHAPEQLHYDAMEAPDEFLLFHRVAAGSVDAGRPDTEFLKRLSDETVRAAVDDLPEDFRETVVLRDLQGFSYQEIAAMLGTPIGTVRSRLARGRALLQKALWEVGGGTSGPAEALKKLDG